MTVTGAPWLAVLVVGGCGREASDPARATPHAPRSAVAPEVTATAAPAPPAPRSAAPPARIALPTPSQSGTFRDHEKTGNRLVREKRYAEAIGEFRLALAIQETNPRVQGELGWAAFLAGDLEAADRATEAALRIARDRRVRGALLYNRGRIAESKNRQGAAIAAYAESLVLRANETVRARLAALDPEAAAGPLAFASREVSDPFPSLEALCASFATPEDGAEDAEGSRLSCADSPQRFAAHEGPLLEAAVFDVFGESTFEGSLSRLALRTERGWQAVQILADTVLGSMYYSATFSVDSVELRQIVPGGAEEVVVRTSVHDASGDIGGRDEGDDVILTSEATTVTVCGLQAGSPLCWARIDTGYSCDTEPPGETRSGQDECSAPYQLSVSFDDAGHVTITRVSGAVPQELARFLGTRALADLR